MKNELFLVLGSINLLLAGCLAGILLYAVLLFGWDYWQIGNIILIPWLLIVAVVNFSKYRELIISRGVDNEE